LRLVYAGAVLYLSLRTWLTFRPRRRIPWEYVWPPADVLLISIGLHANHAAPDSWAMLLYLLPLTQASINLRVRWALLVGLLTAAAYLVVCGTSGLASSAGAFRPFFLLLMASLVAQLGREAARAQRERALSEYKDELSAEMPTDSAVPGEHRGAAGIGAEHDGDRPRGGGALCGGPAASRASG